MWRVSYFLLVLLLCRSELKAQRPYTEDLIAQEVARLGGETEAPSRIVFVAFRGDKFESMHFEMLSHLEAIRWFSSRNSKGTADSLGFLRNCKQLRRIDIHASGQVVEGLSLLRGQACIEEIWLHELSISREALISIATLPKLKFLNLEDIKIDREAGDVIIAIAKRCEIAYAGTTGLDLDKEAELLKAIEERKHASKISQETR